MLKPVVGREPDLASGHVAVCPCPPGSRARRRPGRPLSSSSSVDSSPYTSWAIAILLFVAFALSIAGAVLPSWYSHTWRTTTSTHRLCQVSSFHLGLWQASIDTISWPADNNAVVNEFNSLYSTCHGPNAPSRNASKVRRTDVTVPTSQFCAPCAKGLEESSRHLMDLACRPTTRSCTADRINTSEQHHKNESDPVRSEAIQEECWDAFPICEQLSGFAALLICAVTCITAAGFAYVYLLLRFPINTKRSFTFQWRLHHLVSLAVIASAGLSLATVLLMALPSRDLSTHRGLGCAMFDYVASQEDETSQRAELCAQLGASFYLVLCSTVLQSLLSVFCVASVVFGTRLHRNLKRWLRTASVNPRITAVGLGLSSENPRHGVDTALATTASPHSESAQVASDDHHLAFARTTTSNSNSAVTLAVVPQAFESRVQDHLDRSKSESTGRFSDGAAGDMQVQRVSPVGDVPGSSGSVAPKTQQQLREVANLARHRRQQQVPLPRRESGFLSRLFSRRRSALARGSGLPDNNRQSNSNIDDEAIVVVTDPPMAQATDDVTEANTTESGESALERSDRVSSVPSVQVNEQLVDARVHANKGNRVVAHQGKPLSNLVEMDVSATTSEHRSTQSRPGSMSEVDVDQRANRRRETDTATVHTNTNTNTNTKEGRSRVPMNVEELLPAPVSAQKAHFLHEQLRAERRRADGEFLQQALLMYFSEHDPSRETVDIEGMVGWGYFRGIAALNRVLRERYGLDLFEFAQPHEAETRRRQVEAERLSALEATRLLLQEHVSSPRPGLVDPHQVQMDHRRFIYPFLRAYDRKELHRSAEMLTNLTALRGTGALNTYLRRRYKTDLMAFDIELVLAEDAIRDEMECELFVFYATYAPNRSRSAIVNLGWWGMRNGVHALNNRLHAKYGGRLDLSRATPELLETSPHLLCRESCGNTLAPSQGTCKNCRDEFLKHGRGGEGATGENAVSVEVEEEEEEQVGASELDLLDPVELFPDDGGDSGWSGSNERMQEWEHGARLFFHVCNPDV